jgi:hypothetical protein
MRKIDNHWKLAIDRKKNYPTSHDALLLERS